MHLRVEEAEDKAALAVRETGKQLDRVAELTQRELEAVREQQALAQDGDVARKKMERRFSRDMVKLQAKLRKAENERRASNADEESRSAALHEELVASNETLREQLQVAEGFGGWLVNQTNGKPEGGPEEEAASLWPPCTFGFSTTESRRSLWH